jgi:hypothetical protein
MFARRMYQMLQRRKYDEGLETVYSQVWDLVWQQLLSWCGYVNRSTIYCIIYRCNITQKNNGKFRRI